MTVTIDVTNGLAVQLACHAQYLAESELDSQDYAYMTREATSVEYALSSLVDPIWAFFAIPGAELRYARTDEPRRLGRTATEAPFGEPFAHRIALDIELVIEVASAYAVQLSAFASLVDQGTATAESIEEHVDPANDALTVKAVLDLLEPDYIAWSVPSASVVESVVDPRAVSIEGPDGE